MATLTAVQNGLAENGIPYGLAASSPTTFVGNTINTGTFSLVLSSVISAAATFLVPSGGTLYLNPGFSGVGCTFSGAGTIVHAPGILATSAIGSPITGPNSGGSTPMVFVPLGN